MPRLSFTLSIACLMYDNADFTAFTFPGYDYADVSQNGGKHFLVT